MSLLLLFTSPTGTLTAGGSLPLEYQIRNEATATAAMSWRIQAEVNRSLALEWRITATVGAGSSLALEWLIDGAEPGGIEPEPDSSAEETVAGMEPYIKGSGITDPDWPS